MIRNLKALVPAAIALAVAMIGASSAQAAEFRCAAEPCTYTLLPDEASKKIKEWHHVFIIRQGGGAHSVTCTTMTGEGTTTQVVKEIKIEKIVYKSCFFVGENVTVTTNNCHYLLTNGGTLHIKGCGGGFVEIIKGACTISIGEQSVGGLTFKSIGAVPLREITMEISGNEMTGTASEGCGEIKKGGVTVDYTTGNSLLRGDTNAGLFVETWFE